MSKVITVSGGVEREYMFDITKKQLEAIFDNHLPAVGYVAVQDMNDDVIYLNPVNLGSIQITDMEELGN